MLDCLLLLYLLDYKTTEMPCLKEKEQVLTPFLHSQFHNYLFKSGWISRQQKRAQFILSTSASVQPVFKLSDVSRFTATNIFKTTHSNPRTRYIN